jgi:hypothetical protein
VLGSIFGGFGFGFMMGGWYQMGMIFTAVNILVIVYSIWLASKVYKGKKVQIPIVYNIVKGMIK